MDEYTSKIEELQHKIFEEEHIHFKLMIRATLKKMYMNYIFSTNHNNNPFKG